jgi:hypothetical protein
LVKATDRLQISFASTVAAAEDAIAECNCLRWVIGMWTRIVQQLDDLNDRMVAAILMCASTVSIAALAVALFG